MVKVLFLFNVVSTWDESNIEFSLRQIATTIECPCSWRLFPWHKLLLEVDPQYSTFMLPVLVVGHGKVSLRAFWKKWLGTYKQDQSCVAGNRQGQSRTGASLVRRCPHHHLTLLNFKPAGWPAAAVSMSRKCSLVHRMLRSVGSHFDTSTPLRCRPVGRLQRQRHWAVDMGIALPIEGKKQRSDATDLWMIRRVMMNAVPVLFHLPPMFFCLEHPPSSARTLFM